MFVRSMSIITITLVFCETFDRSIDVDTNSCTQMQWGINLEVETENNNNLINLSAVDIWSEKLIVVHPKEPPVFSSAG